MSVWLEPKVDCHNHVVDPARFPYQRDTLYRPAGQEVAPAHLLLQMMDVFAIRHALIVGPNSGYGTDNSCLLDALDCGEGRCKGIAVVPNDIAIDDLAALQARGVIGVAFNPTAWGLARYLDTADLLAKLVELEMFLQIQTEGDQILALMPLIAASPVRLLVDHCGRPVVADGLGAPGFQAIVELGRSGRATVKLSGHLKFSREPHPHRDTVPFIAALVEAFTLDACVWGSDWPWLKAEQKVDTGMTIALVAAHFPDPDDRARLFWHTPNRLFGFSAAPLSCRTVVL